MDDLVFDHDNVNESSIYLAYKHNHRKWFRGKAEEGNEVVIQTMTIHNNSLRSGFGLWDETKQRYHFVWDKRFSVSDGKPEPLNDVEYKPAFSCYVKVAGIDEPLIWRSHQYGQRMGFQQMCSTFWTKEFQSKHPVVSLKDIKNLADVNTSAPQFELVKFIENDDFILPKWYDNQDLLEESQNDQDNSDEIPF
jgi:hypothetical protein